MDTIALPKTEYLRLKKIESLYRRHKTPIQKPSEVDTSLSKWVGAFSPIDPEKTTDIRLQAIHRKHVK